MAFSLNFDTPLFTLEFSTDAAPSPDVLDTVLTRFSRAVSESLAQVAPHAGVILGEDSDDDE
jgi:hypothetical protein